MPATAQTRAMVLAAAQVCEDKKGTETRILELDPADSGLTDFFLITSGNNNRQTGAIADEIELRMKREFGTYARSVEGRRNGEWILLDYVDFVVHIFTEQTRAFYDIERLRKSAHAMDAAELASTLKAKTEAAREKPAAKKTAAKKASAKKSAAAKKSPAAKAPAGKAAPKKPAAKKPAAAVKKAVKKAAQKPATAKKTAVKKTVASRPAVKKTATRKASAKKAASATKTAAKSAAKTKRSR